MTLFVVSLVLLVLIMRDQRRAVVKLETASEHEALATANTPPAAPAPTSEDAPEDAPDARAIPAGDAGSGRHVGGAGPHRLAGRHRHPDLAGHPGPHGLELLTRYGPSRSARPRSSAAAPAHA